MTSRVSDIDQLLAATAWYRTRFPEPRPRRPRLGLAIVSCMDSRLDLFGALGLEVGDAHLIRNAGGVITDDVLRSLAISQREIGTKSVMVVQHTNCGMFGFNDAEFRSKLNAVSGQMPGWDVPGFTNLETSVRRALDTLRDCGWLVPGERRGFIFDVKTAEFTEVTSVQDPVVASIAFTDHRIQSENALFEATVGPTQIGGSGA